MSPVLFEVTVLPILDTSSPDQKYRIALAQRYREYRLRALREDPAAFASTYEEEEKRGLEQSLSRLCNPAATKLVALQQAEVAIKREDDGLRQDSALRLTWVGMIVLLGPQLQPHEITAKADSFATMTMSSQELSTSPPRELYFHLTGTFVSKEARNSGVGRALIAKALAIARKEARAKATAMTCTLLVDADNEAACRLYASSGFEPMEQQTYTKRVLLDDTVNKEQRVAVLMRRREQQSEDQVERRGQIHGADIDAFDAHRVAAQYNEICS